MKKKLPNLYKGVVKNPIKNQKHAILSSKEEIVNQNVDNERNVGRQIKDIFNSPSYVYKANVSIIMQSGENIKKTIIGRTNNSLITMDDELIDVSQISQIDFLD